MTEQQQLLVELPPSITIKKPIEDHTLLDLGSKKHWDACYERGLVNFSDNQDIGEIWYGQDAAKRVVNYIEKEHSQESSIIDLGCGNGAVLLDLAEEGFNKLYGVDYSQEAVDLANQIVKSKDYNIEYACADLCVVSNEGLLSNKYDICHDKGTYDAISMCPENPTEKKNAYIKTVYGLLNINGVFIITFCNWTEEELLQQFEGHFEKIHTLPVPTFMFGGNIGSFVTTVVFKKRLYPDIWPRDNIAYGSISDLDKLTEGHPRTEAHFISTRDMPKRKARSWCSGFDQQFSSTAVHRSLASKHKSLFQVKKTDPTRSTNSTPK